MIDLKTTYGKIINELQPRTEAVGRMVKLNVKVAHRKYSNIASKQKAHFVRAYDAISSMSTLKKIYILFSAFYALFFIWQIAAYNFSQPVFVTVNLLMLTIFTVSIVLVLRRIYNLFQRLHQNVDDLVIARKRKEQEVQALKSELLDYKVASSNKRSFGKNSQALIDAVKKNRSQIRADELPGQFILRAFAQCYEICGGIVYMINDETGKFEYAGDYALIDEPTHKSVTEEDGLIGEVIRSGKAMTLKDVPSDVAVAMSGLGRTKMLHVYILPVKMDEQVVAVVEVSSFGKLAIADIWGDIDNLLLS